MSSPKRILSWDVGIKNLAYCGLHDKQIIAWKLLCLPSCKPEDLCSVLCKVLDAEVFPEALDVVVVERQPGRNKTMLRVEAYLAMYFAKLGIQVVTYHAGNKLKDTGQENRGRGSHMYRARKNASVDLARDFLLETKQDAGVLVRAKKKDDLADALMQGLSYLSARTVPDVSVNKVIRPRKPTERQKKLSKSNILYLLKEKLKHTLFAFVPGTPLKIIQSLGDAKLQTAIVKAFGSLEVCAAELGHELVVPETPFLGKVGTDDPVGLDAIS